MEAAQVSSWFLASVSTYASLEARNLSITSSHAHRITAEPAVPMGVGSFGFTGDGPAPPLFCLEQRLHCWNRLSARILPASTRIPTCFR